MSESCKIRPEQVEKINKLTKDKDLNYRSQNDFVVQATDHELRLATLKHGLSEMGKYHFDMLYNELLRKAYERSAEYDQGIKNYGKDFMPRKTNKEGKPYDSFDK
jgi:hypothetical protein